MMIQQNTYVINRDKTYKAYVRIENMPDTDAYGYYSVYKLAYDMIEVAIASYMVTCYIHILHVLQLI